MARITWGKVAPALVVLVCASLIPAGCARAAQLSPTPSLTEHALTVLGQGTVSASPDVASASIGVETVAPTVAEATRENSATMATVIARLKEMGVAENDIQTAGYSISSQPEPAATPAGAGYRVSNVVQAKIRDLQQVGPILDGAIQAGANQVYGVTFSLEDRAAAEAQARAAAMDDARARAADLARLAGLQLGDMLAVSEVAPTSVPVAQGAVGGAGGAQAPPISPGETQVTAQVLIAYAIR